MSTSCALFKRYFAFDAWGNRLQLSFLKKHPDFSHRTDAVTLFSHLHAAQQVWHTRITGEDSSRLEIWPELSLAQNEKLMAENEKRWHELLEAGNPDLEQVISYQNSKGIPYENTLEELLTHLIIHGQHHRAQINTLISRSGLNAPAIDYIYYCRES